MSGGGPSSSPSTCPHINIVGDYTKDDIIQKQELSKCDSCDARGPNLWTCLHRNCLYVGCGENFSDHSTKHFQDNPSHTLALNLTTLRVWCYECEFEVFLENNDPPLPNVPPVRHISANKVYRADADTDDEEEGENLKPRGLTGLQNLGNTCYMNAALQALSNCPHLTNFFLDCEPFVRSEKKPGLAKSYMRLIKDMWHKKRPSYVVPSSIAYGIKCVCPVFRGYTQQDAQEFLRCFMDQLHEELKEPVVELKGCSGSSCDSMDDYDSCHGETSTAAAASEDSSQSEAEFETCDSGLSSEKSSCSEECTDGVEGNDVLMEDDEEPQCAPNPSPHSHNNPLRSCIAQQNKLNESAVELKDSGNSSSRQSIVEDGIKNCGGGECLLEHTPSGNHSPDRSDIGSCRDRCSPTASKRDLSRRQNLLFNGRVANMSSEQSLKVIQPNQTQVVFNPRSSFKRKKNIPFRSIISDVFDGKILSSVQCLTCDTIQVSTTKETFQDLSLPIPSRDHLHMLHASQGNQVNQKGTGACTDVYKNQGWFNWMFGWMLSWFWGPTVSLQDCLSAFFSADELKGDNMYSCDKCKKLRNGIKYSKVLQLPEVLCIHLKRFRLEVMFSSKISSYVSFPLEGLDMSPFLHKDCSRGETMYDLFAVICHHGTAGSGHYTAYALNNLNDQWYEFDDQYVTVVDPQVVQNCEAYVLFYRKSSEEIIKKRQRTVELMELSKNEPGLLQFYVSKQWINKFNTFAEPGPITNTDFLCIHGGVHPNKASYVEELCVALSQGVWEYLHDTFGGGPACTHLYVCPICHSERENLEQRRKQEYEKFKMLKESFTAQDSPTVVHAISMNWFKQWQNFVYGKENDALTPEPPGPIDNSSICYVKGNQAILKLGSDYATLSEDMWKFLYGIYGGGPEIVHPHSTPQNLASMLPVSAMHGTERALQNRSSGGHINIISNTPKIAHTSQSSWTTTAHSPSPVQKMDIDSSSLAHTQTTHSSSGNQSGDTEPN